MSKHEEPAERNGSQLPRGLPRMMTDETREHLERVKRDATALAESLRDASDAGVPHGLILPQLVAVFRQAFGEMPPNLMQQLGGLTQ